MRLETRSSWAMQPQRQMTCLGILLLRVGQNAQVAEHPLLGVLPDGAGVEDDEIRLLGILRQRKAHLLQHAHELCPSATFCWQPKVSTQARGMA